MPLADVRSVERAVEVHSRSRSARGGEVRGAEGGANGEGEEDGEDGRDDDERQEEGVTRRWR